MKSFIVEKDGKMRIGEVSNPVISSTQALVKTIACGMCGTDIKLIHRTFKGFPEDVYPITLGHEGVGEVIEVGTDVKGYKIGDKVLLPFATSEGYGSGWGALSEYAVVDDVKAFPKGEEPVWGFAQTVLPDDIDPVDAVMLVTFREVLSSIRYFDIKAANSIVVFGCGPVGSTFIKFLSLTGVKNIIAVDIFDDKLEIAKSIGATHTINSKDQDLAAAVRAIYPDGVDFVLDAVGLPFIVNQAMALINDRGAVLCYGVPEKEEITIDFSKASYNFRVIYQQMPRKDEEGAATDQVLEWVRNGQLVIKDFISDYFKFEDSVEAYEKLLARKILKKGIITYN
ncbi:zinc-dependent alcohol dehydrogenase [Candidatus Epulonipiscium viviparus]|uniref:zinc-dependent alcohol dehydrogenase n=1 Tax=Candidatus Epulonipiscium viviparus TaxID=420336 RepID=UPI0027380E7E|nr:zinc-binding dehydrogenase [Candidatus Epulopiscium viviparus]